MAVELEKLVLNVTANTKDLDKLKTQLQETKKEGTDAGKSVSESFNSLGGVLQAVGAAFVGSKIISYFRSAINEAASLEDAMQKVASTARAFKIDTKSATKAAQDLANDGFMSAQQSAQALSNLMQTGLSLDQAKKFVTASKDITAFGNTIGNAAQATTDLTAGLLKGSALVIDNASPALKSLSSQYQKILDTQGKAKAAQYAYNAILKESAKFSGDAARSMDTLTGAQKKNQAATAAMLAAVGNALTPAYKGFLSVLTSVTEWFTKLFNSLGSATQLTVLLVAATATIAAAFGALGISFDTVAKQAARMWLAITGPVGLVVAAIGAVAISLAMLHDKMKPQETTGQAALREKAALEDIAKARKLSVAEQQKLNELSNQLNNTYGVILKNLNAQNAAYSKQRELIGAIDDERKKAAELDSEGRANRQIKLEKQLSDKQKEAIELQAKIDKALATAAETKPAYIASLEQWQHSLTDRLQRDLSKINIDIDNKKAALEVYKPGTDAKTSAPQTPVFTGGTRDTTEKRFNETVTALKEIAKNLKDTKKNIPATLLAEGYKKGTVSYDAELARRTDQAEEFLVIAEDRAKNSQRQIVAEYLELQVEADRVALEQKYNDAIAASHEILNYELLEGKGNAKKIMQAKKEHAERLANFEKQKAIETSKIYAESFERTLNAANAIATGVGGIINAKDAGGALSGVGGVMSGLGGLKELSPALGALGPWGAAIGAAGGIVSTLTGLFGKSDEERQREAAEQARRDEEARRLLELQANYQKNMLTLQEAQAKLPFENLQKDLRLIDIKAQQRRLAGESETTVEEDRLKQRRDAISAVISQQAGTVAGGKLFGNVGSTPDEMIEFLKERASQVDALKIAEGIVNPSRWSGDRTVSEWRAQYAQALSELNGVKTLLPEEVYDTINNFLKNQIANEDATARQIVSSSVRNAFVRDVLIKSGGYRNLAYHHSNAEQSALSNMTSGLFSEIRSDTSVAENMASLFEQLNQTNLQIAANTKQIAENTLPELRNRNIISVFGDYIQSAGFRSLENLSLPETVGSAVLQTQKTNSTSDTLLTVNIEQLNVQRDMLDALLVIADSGLGAGGSMSISQLSNMLSRIRERSVR